MILQITKNVSCQGEQVAQRPGQNMWLLCTKHLYCMSLERHLKYRTLIITSWI